MAAPSAHEPPEPDDGSAASSPEPSGDPVEYEPSDWEPVITRPDPMTEEEREAWLNALEEPFDPEEYPDPEGPPPPGEDELTAGEIAGILEVTEAEAWASAQAVRSGTTGALAAIAASAGRRGPGQPGSAQVFPGESGSRAAAFGTGLVLDVMPGCPDLAMLADAAAGPDDTYDGASDDELIGVLCAWDRLEAHMAARKLAAAAELIRRRPEPGCAPEGPARMPAAWEEFTAEELAYALAEHCGRAEDLLTIAAARDARVQRWAEDSGNEALMGRELPPAEVLAADQRITAWARQLRQAGLEGDMDVLRARAYLDLLLGMDSRPGQDAAGRQDGGGLQDGAGGQESGGPQGPGSGSGPRGDRACPRAPDLRSDPMRARCRPGSPGGST